MRLSVTSPPGRRETKPPASLRGTMESGSTGQMCSDNPPPAWRGVAPGTRRPRPGARLHGKAQSAAPASRRMRLFVTSSPGRRGTKPPARLRGTMESGSTGQTRPSNPPPACGGVCARVRRPRPGAQLHGKAQSAAPASRRMRLSVTSPPGRRGAQPPASLRGTMESGPTGQMRSSNPRQAAGGLCRGPQASAGGPGLTEKRSLGRGPR